MAGLELELAGCRAGVHPFRQAAGTAPAALHALLAPDTFSFSVSLITGPKWQSGGGDERRNRSSE